MNVTESDVLAVLVRLASLGGVVVETWNVPRATSTIRSHLRPATTPQVRAALRKAEQAGYVLPAAAPARRRDLNAADGAELYWRITPAALMLAKGGAE